MYIKRNGAEFKLTAEEIFCAHKEFVINWMKNTLEEEFSIPEAHSGKYAELAYDKYSEGNGESEYQCVEAAAEEYEKLHSFKDRKENDNGEDRGLHQRKQHLYISHKRIAAVDICRFV